MNSLKSQRRAGAFTLVEMLCVIAIIAILAALLLPTLGRAKDRAKRIRCVGQLKEQGTAFHMFAHDHESRFPMAVPAREGGSLEFVQAGYGMKGEFYFAFRHFQVLSNQLVTPRLVACPSDVRFAAPNFGALKNENVSYFVSATADYTKPMSILSGDRNLTNDWVPPGTILQTSAGGLLRWTRELHRFKGNLLFADAHVEELNSVRLDFPRNPAAAGARLVLPSVRSAASTPINGPVIAAERRAATLLPAIETTGASTTNSGSARRVNTNWTWVNATIRDLPPPAQPPAETNRTPPVVAPVREIPPPTPAIAPPAVRETAPAPVANEFVQSAQELVGTVKWWLYVLLALLLIVMVALRIRYLAQRRRK